jgi:two-component system cell cycle sensor histidine kinase/response regulator CckA
MSLPIDPSQRVPPSPVAAGEHRVIGAPSDGALTRALLDASSEMAWAIDRQYRLLTANAAFQAAAMATIGRPMVPGESVLVSTLPAAVRQHWKQHYDAAFDGASGEVVSEMPTATGPLLLELRTAPLRLPDGAIIGCAATCRDLSDGSGLDRELHARQQLERALFEDHPHPMWIFDDESLAFLAVNRSAVAGYGWSTEQFRAMTILDIRPPDAVGTILHQVTSESLPRGEDSGAWVHVRADGSRLDVEVHTAPITFQGRPARLVTAIDITATRTLARRARHREAILRDTADAMPVGVMLLDQAGAIQWANRAARAVIGTEELGDDLMRVHPADVRAVRERRTAYLQGDHSLGEPHDVRFVHADGHTVWATMRAVPLRASTDSEGMHLFTVADRTADMHTRAAEQEQRTRRQRQQHLEGLGTMAAGLSHEFRNLLTVISGHVELLELTTFDDPEFRESLTALATTTQRGRELLKSILAFSRGPDEATTSWSDAIPHVRAATQLARPTLGEVSLVNSVPDLPGESPLSAGEWMQLLLNVLQNSAHATRGRADGTVEVSAALATLETMYELPTGRVAAGTYLCVTVRDNGVGVAPEHLSRLFDPFFSTRSADGGTGMGLSVVAGILRRVGGGVDVASQPGVGTSFVLFVPCRRTTVAPPPAAAALSHVLVLSTDVRRKRAIEQHLRDAGWMTTATSQPLMAIAYVRADPGLFDAIYVDFDLGRTTGIEVAEAVAVIAMDVPVVLGVVGEVALDESAVSARGVTSILPDTLDTSEVVSAVRRAIRRARHDS